MARKQQQQTRIVLVFLGIFALLLVFHTISSVPSEISQLKYHEFEDAISLPESDPNRVVEVTFQEKEIMGKRVDGSTFKTFAPYDEILRKKLDENKVRINFEAPEERAWWTDLLIHSLPVILIILLLMFFMRQIQIGGGKAMSFGKSRAKLMNESDAKISFKDVAGVEESKEELEEIVSFLKEPKKFTKLGGRIPKGVLLIGPPGTGKTLLAKAVAGEAGVPFFSISGSDFVEMFVGVGASRVRDLFEQAKKHAPCIVFIDEIDAVGRHRGAGMGGGHDEREQTLNQLLVEMDGFESNEGVILIAATNRVDVLDPALLRPGRFDRRIIVSNPDVRGREEILKVHTRKTPLNDSVRLRAIAQGTPGFSGADLENLVNEAALLAARDDASELSNSHFELAKDKVMMGPARRSMVIQEKERRVTAYHEAGHAIVAKSISANDPVHKVTIVPRGMALGVTMLLPDDDRLSMSREEAEAIISYAMGGRAAEEIVFGHFTTGASDDIRKASEMARKMVCQWGMSDRLGPVDFAQKSSDPFLGRDIGRQTLVSEKVAEEIDLEVRSIITSQYKRAISVLNEKRKILDHFAEVLLVRETVEGQDLDRLLKGETILTQEDRQRYQEQRKTAQKEKDTPLFGAMPLPQGT